MQRKTYYWISIALVLLLLASLACGLTGGEEATATPAPPPPPPPATQPLEPTAAPDVEAPESTTPASNAVSSLEDVRRAVVQIEAQGSFVDPQVGLQLNVAGSGSGFIIDESGIAVTNNHVVTGAALLRVWVGGESQPRNARVLGVSECSDLAVIDIDGEGYPYLEWHDGPISTGLDVYAAGFPLGDPEFTLTRGIVSKERASGETNWASVDAVVEHDATINPGNSGGPLVTADGKLVGVNYSGAFSVNQYFAIARDEAIKIIDQLQAGQDVTSIGVNGEAVADGSISGIWVSSVKSGSPADRAGVQGGDIITMIEGLVLATDGTMSDYCDILRTHGSDSTLRLEVLRYATEEVLEGQLNGRELEQVFSFAQEIEEQVGADLGEDFTGGAGYDEYMEVWDDTDTLVMEIPVEWSRDFDGRPYLADDGSLYAADVQASTDLDAFWDTYSTPGVRFLASNLLALDYNEGSLLDEFGGGYGACVYDGRFEYDDGLYTGLYDLYADCDEVGSVIVELAAVPDHRGFIILIQIQAITDADLEALDRILATFMVVGDMP
ncbi:MAG: serine protease [Anaerolineales bacterium]|nr:serine protease [Anaerolineales bacterium]